MSDNPAPAPARPDPGESEDFDYRARLRWLVILRWWAMTGAMVGTGLSIALKWEFVNAPGVAAGVFVGAVVNGVLMVRATRGRRVGEGELALHIVFDLLLLTWLLAWAGGIKNPIAFAFCFHVVLGALLTGRSGALAAIATSVAGGAALVTLEHSGWLPSSPLALAPEALTLLSLFIVLAGLSYFALLLSTRLRSERENAQRRQREAEGSLELLTDTLDALSVGIEVVDPESHAVRLQNPFARRLRRRLEQAGRTFDIENADKEGPTLVLPPQDEDDRGERLFDVVSLSPTLDVPLRAVLYVDRTEERLVQQRHFMLERLATLGRALQGVAHELNTPLTTMQTLAKDLKVALKDAPLDEADREDIEESIDLIVEESRRCRTLTQSLLSTAHEEAGREGEILLQVARRAVRLLGSKVDADRSEVLLDEPALTVPLAVDSDRVLQILMNLIQNALKATESLDSESPHVEVTAERVDGHLAVHILDRGPGLPDEVRARLFEPFVTTRPAGEGTGLGLYTSHMIAHELGGRLLLRDRRDGGTEALLELPA